MSSKPYTIVDVAKGYVEGTIRYVDSDKQNQRLSVCQQCDRLNSLLSVCKECGCFVKTKVKFEQSSCPMGKW